MPDEPETADLRRFSHNGVKKKTIQFRRWKHFVEGSERRTVILAQADRSDKTTQITISVVSRNSRSVVLQLKNTFGSASDSQELGSETTAGTGLSED